MVTDNRNYPKVEDMVGQTMVSVENISGDALQFTTTDGKVYRLWHNQDCCESLEIDDVVGDLSDLVGVPMLIAREDSNVPETQRESKYTEESFTWTFYNFATVKGYVTVKWYGSSNGYYSESVDFDEVSSA